MIRGVLVVLLLLLSACSSQEKGDFKLAEKNVNQGNYKVALDYFDRVILRNNESEYPLEAAREAARVSFFELKDYERTINYHRFIVLHSKDEKERVQSQKQIAEIYFNNLQNYQASIVEFSKLQQMPHTDLEASQYQMSIARANYYMNNFFQAESEIDSLLRLKSDDNIRFQALMLKGNILVAKKEFVKAIDIFKGIIDKYPQRSIQENVGLVLAVCYEENDNFKDAIKVLEGYRDKYSPPEYIELRIKRLQERMKNAPGAKGFRK
ncbi:tetratricopeptide repeat protein [Bdellovibrio sp. HCB290]|uniref:tetratricopeptide repeat protein n=1 Tax=Bdellovibrio sp. HCB290 TaxID=3394356 RepID=UPI0039B479E1